MEDHLTASQPIEIVAAVIFNEGKVLLTRRFKGQHLGGLWEFPGGKIEKGETRELALAREIREEIGVQIRVVALIFERLFAYENCTVRLNFFKCEIIDGNPQALGVAKLAWVNPLQLYRYEMPAANQPMVSWLQGIEDALIPPY